MQKAQVIKVTHRESKRNQGCPIALYSHVQSGTRVPWVRRVNPMAAIVAQPCFSVLGRSLSVQRLSEV